MFEQLLIQLVERHPHLYDKSRHDFHDVRKKENSWDEIAAGMSLGAEEDVSPEDCQRVWTNLRNRFAKEQRARRTVPSGSSADDQPTWSLYTSLLFLSKHIKPRRTTSNLTSRTKKAVHPLQTFDFLVDSGALEQDVASNAEVTHASDSSMEDSSRGTSDDLPSRRGSVCYESQMCCAASSSRSASVERMTQEATAGSTRQNTNPGKPATPQLLKRKRSAKADGINEHVGNAIIEMSSVVKTMDVKKETPDTIFGHYVAVTLQTLSEENKKRAKREIVTLLTDLEAS